MDSPDITHSFVEFITNPTVIKVFGIVLATLLVNFFLRGVFNHLEKRASNTHTVWDDALLSSVRKPTSLLIWILGIAFAAETISAETDTGLQNMIDPVRYISVVGVLTFFLVRFINECEKGFIHNGADITTTTAIGKLVRISVFITAALTVLQTLGVSVQGILAFGGVGGIAVGFAAKDLLANFFGGLMIYLDRPFAVGDWIRSPDRDIEGTVEVIGWRLTVIRSFQQRPIYVPNSVFANIAVENPSRMHNRRIYETIGLRYDDIAAMKSVVAEVDTMLREHEEIDQGRTLMVNFNTFGGSSLEFFIYCFTKTTNWVEFHKVKQDVLLKIHAIIDRHDAEIAFPTTTVHLAPPEMEQEN